MSNQKLFDFTKQLENSLAKLLESPTMGKDKKADLRHKLQLVAEFNQLEFLSEKQQLKVLLF